MNTWVVIKDKKFQSYIVAKTKYDAMIQAMLKYGIVTKVKRVNNTKVIIGGFSL